MNAKQEILAYNIDQVEFLKIFEIKKSLQIISYDLAAHTEVLYRVKSIHVSVIKLQDYSNLKSVRLSAHQHLPRKSSLLNLFMRHTVG